jgi:hypothetical protein
MNFKAKYIFKGLLYAVLLFITCIYVGNAIPWGIGFLEVFYYIIIGAAFVTLVVYTLWECDEREQVDYEQLLARKFLPVKLPGSLIFWIVMIIIVYNGIIFGGKLSNLYNRSIVYNKEYSKATQALDGYYDNMWKTYATKEKLTFLSKDAFIQVTSIIFDGRKDGASVAWKWVHENQQVPYDQFLSFYKDLSNYAEQKRDGYYALEVNRQQIAAAHNMLIDTFPNNYYNKVLNRPHIDYKYGMLSDSTVKVFATGKENNPF